MDAASSHCGCGLHDHQRMLKRGQEKKQSGERQREREKEGGREGRERAAEREESLLTSSFSSANPADTAACHMANSSSLLSASSLGIHIHGHTHSHKHTAYLVMVQRAAPARTERNWINGSLGAAQQNTGNCP